MCKTLPIKKAKCFFSKLHRQKILQRLTFKISCNALQFDHHLKPGVTLRQISVSNCRTVTGSQSY